MSRWEPGSRGRLIEAAFDLFERQGFAQTTVPQIAAAAGVTNRTFYRHFGDKRDVVFDTDRDGADALRDALVAADSGLSSSEFVALAIRELMRERFDGRRDEERRRRLIIDSDESLRERAAHKRERQHALLGAILRERGFDPMHARLLAETMTSAMNLAVDEWLSRDDRVRVEYLALDALAVLRGDLG